MQQPSKFTKNTYKLIWSDEALIGLKEIIGYLEYKFSERDIKKFVRILDKHFEILKKEPETFPLISNSKSVRRVIIAKLTSIYYKINEDKILLLSIYDNRKNPDKLNYDLT